MPDSSPPHDVLPCDCCGADMSARLDQLIHVAGTLNGIECNHIHLCPQCAVGLNLPRIAVSRGKCVPIPLSAQGLEPGYWPAPHQLSQLSADTVDAASEQVRWGIIHNEDPTLIVSAVWETIRRGAWLDWHRQLALVKGMFESYPSVRPIYAEGPLGLERAEYQRRLAVLLADAKSSELNALSSLAEAIILEVGTIHPEEIKAGSMAEPKP